MTSSSPLEVKGKLCLQTPSTQGSPAQRGPYLDIPLGLLDELTQKAAFLEKGPMQRPGGKLPARRRALPTLGPQCPNHPFEQKVTVTDDSTYWTHRQREAASIWGIP